MSYLHPPSSLPPGAIVDSYRRDSGGVRQDQSTDQQLTELEAYCQTYNLVHRHHFVDEAKSGGSTAGRDDFNRMLDLYARPGQRPHGLLLWNYARFARDIDDAQFNKIRIRQWGIAIHSLNDSIPEGDHGRIIEFLIDVANEEKRKQTSIDAKRGLKDLVQKYRCVPGTPPRGFKREPFSIGMRRDKTAHIAHRWVPDPELIPRVQKAFAMKAARATLKQIHDETQLYNSLNSYQGYFENQLYIGTLRFADLTIENYCEPMIDPKTWDAVQRILRANSQHKNLTNPETHPRRQNGSYLLSGLVRCSRCGSPLWGMTSKQRNGSYYLRYACTRAKRRRDCDFKPIPAHVLEAEVIKRINAFFIDPGNLHELMELHQKQIAEPSSEGKAVVRDLQKQIGAVHRSIGNLVSAISESGHSKSMLNKLASLEAKDIDLRTHLNQVKTQAGTIKPALTQEKIMQLAQYMIAHLAGKDPSIVRQVLLAAIHQITVDRIGNCVHGVIQVKNSSGGTKKTSEENREMIVMESNRVTSKRVFTAELSMKFVPVSAEHLDVWRAGLCQLLKLLLQEDGGCRL